MDYNFHIQLSYEQLLALVLQLPKEKQERLTTTINEQNVVENQSISYVENKKENWNIAFKVKTIQQILAKDYVYKPIDKHKLVGCWEGNETVEDLLALRTK
jgi:hypothetical protein